MLDRYKPAVTTVAPLRTCILDCSAAGGCIVVVLRTSAVARTAVDRTALERILVIPSPARVVLLECPSAHSPPASIRCVFQ